jgi:hypothetical protein
MAVLHDSLLLCVRQSWHAEQGDLCLSRRRKRSGVPGTRLKRSVLRAGAGKETSEVSYGQPPSSHSFQVIARASLQRLIRCTALGAIVHLRRPAHRFEQDPYHGDALPTELTGLVARAEHSALGRGSFLQFRSFGTACRYDARSSGIRCDRSRTVGRSGLALGAVVGVQWGRTARARHTTNSTGRAFHADRARTTGGGRRPDWGCPGRGGFGVLAGSAGGSARRAGGCTRHVHRGRTAVPAAAAVHFLANRDAHADRDSQRLA